MLVKGALEVRLSVVENIVTLFAARPSYTLSLGLKLNNI